MTRKPAKRAPTPSDWASKGPPAERSEREARVERARQAAEARKSAGVPPELVAALAVSVPECIARWRADGWTHERVVARAHECGEVLCHPGGGDVLQFGGTGRGVAKQQAQVDFAFAALTDGLAAGSFCPGGASFAGLHWESDPAWLNREGT